MEEVHKKSLRDFHKTHPSGSGTVAEDPPRVAKITPTVTSEGTGEKPGVPDVTNDDSSESESESWGNDEDNNNNEQESSDESMFDHENESKDDKMKSNEEQGMDDTTNQFDDDTDARLEEPTKTATGIVQGTDTEMTEAQQGNENLETTQEQVVEDTHMMITTITKKIEVLVTSSSRSSDLATKFLNFSDIPHTDVEIVSPLDVHVHHEVSRPQVPTLLSIPVSVIPESSPVFTNIPQSSHTFTPTPILVTPTPPPTIQTTNPLSNLPGFSSSFTARIKEQVKDQLPHILPQEVSNFASPVIEKLFHKTRDEVTLAKHEQKDKDKDEDPSAGSDRGLKRRKTSKDADPTTEPKKKDSTSGTSKDSDMPHDHEGNLGDNEDEPRKKNASKSPTQTWLMNLAASNSSDKSLKDFDELMSTPIDFSSFVLNGLNINNLTQEILQGPAFRLLKGTRSNYAELEYDFEECYKALSEKLDWENPKGGDYPFDLSKPLPLIIRGKHQKVPFEFFINNGLKYLQGGISTMTYTTSTTKTKAAQYDLPGIEDMVPNIWSPVKVAYDKYALWGISHWREKLTHVSVMRKYGYGYLEEIVVRRADNVLYRFKEGEFPRLRINNIEDMLILVVQNRLSNLLGDDVADFAIALRIKRHPYTSYKDPQGFIYVDDNERNRLMCSDELYKFSDGTLTRLLSSLEDITKNIDMAYLPKRRWSTLEKKRAHFIQGHQ
ncbi:hypothetical protein Tco_0360941 [Tanacetum coccineum]